MYIENMQGPEDVKKLTLEQLPVLAEEMRHALLFEQASMVVILALTLVW